MSERSLRRHLSQRDTSFRLLLQEVRLFEAKKLLKTTALTVNQIALKLGYQEAANFRSAFKSWTGLTPIE